MLTFKQTGRLKKTERLLLKLGKGDFFNGLDAIAKRGVEALREATPVKTGKTAESWSYTIEKTKDKVSISFNNSNINKGANVAILIQYGHATPQGYYIEGIDYINPALRPIFQDMGNRVWKEVTENA